MPDDKDFIQRTGEKTFEAIEDGIRGVASETAWVAREIFGIPHPESSDDDEDE